MKRFFGVLALVVFVMALGNAQQIGLKAVGGEVGYNSFSFADESFGGLAFGAVANLGELTQGLSLYPSVTYAMGSKNDVDVSDLAINANVKYSFKAEGFTPYVGGGIGLNIVSVTTPAITVPFFGTVGGGSESETRIGINLLGGAEMKLGNMTGFAQFGYNLVSDFNHFQILAGVMFPLN